MPTFRAVTQVDYSRKRWRKPASYSFAAALTVTPLVASEFPKAAVAMPIVFIEQDGRFVPVALMSPFPGRNLFVGQAGQWLGAYVPASLRAYPFILARPVGQQDFALCVAEDDDLVVPASDPAGADFFSSGVTLAPETKGVVDFLTTLEQHRAATDAAVGALAAASLIKPWRLGVTLEGVTRPLEGVYSLDEHALAALDDETFLALRRARSLPLAYLQVLSTGQIAQFQQLAKLHKQLAQQPASEAASDRMSSAVAEVEELFAQIDPKGELFG
jgi:hypothetical protein